MVNFKKRFLSIMLLIVVSTFFLSGCGNKDPLVAKWQNAEWGITMQFAKDGSLLISNQKTFVKVTYEKQDPDILQVTGSADGNYPNQTLTYRIEEDRLILTLDGVESVFTRVK